MGLRTSFETRVLAAFSVAVLVVAALAATTWKMSQDAVEAMRWVSHTHEVLDELANARGDTLAIELSTQSHRISGDPAQLVERDAAISARETSLRRIKELTADNARQQEHWARLRETADQRLAISRRVAQLRESEGVEAANAYVASAPLQETRKRLFQLLREMDEEENRLLDERITAQQHARQIVLATGALAALALIALLTATYILIRRQMRASESSRRALEVARTRIAAILDAVADGVVTVDQDGTVQTVNPAVERMFGYGADEMIGCNVKMLMPEPHRNEHDGYLKRYRATGEARVIGTAREVEGRRKDGSSFELELALSEMRLGAERHFTGVLRDITKRKRAEVALRESEENLSTILQSIGDAVLATDTDGCVIRMNPVAERLTGWSFPQAQGRPIDEVFRIVNEQTRAPAVVPVAKVLATGEIQGLANHTVLIARDGRECPIADSAAPIRDASGRVSGVVLVFRDVTTERQTERTVREQNELLEQRVRERTAQLRESEERFRLLVESAKDYAIIMLDPQGHVVTWNEGARWLNGYAEAEILGQPMERFYSPEDVAEGKPARLLAQAVAEDRCEDEGWRVRKDGARFYADMILTPIRNQAGELVGFSKITRDIGERKRMEQELRASEQKFIRFFMQAPIPLVVINNDGSIVFANDQFTEVLGYTTEDIPTLKEWWQLAYPEASYRQEVMDSWGVAVAIAAKKGTIVEPLECRVTCKSGAERTVLISGILIEDKVLATFIDISERKRAEQEIQDLNASLERRVAERTLQLEEASRAKSDFLANMSHELRTPLNAIIGFSEMLKDGLLGEMDTKQRGFVADIFDAGTHLLALINDILDLSKVEAGMQQLEVGAVDVVALLKASTLIVREKALAHRIRLDTQLDPALDTLLIDERKLKQIVYNLLSNAVKFTLDGGAVTLRARRCARTEVAFDEAMPARLVALPAGKDGEFLAITVEDTGLGIAEEHLPKLFEPFMQVDSSVARRQGGTGLGLSLVRRFAELHGGTVGVASRPGTGSRFCVWLPYRAAVLAAREGGVAPAATARAGPAVPLALVIEDDDRMADLIAAQLRAEGFEVMRAATAEEGLVRAAKHQPQLITLDIFLPAMDGWEFMHRLKAEPKLADTPVVIITVAGDLERGLALGARRVLHKPFARQELVAALAGLVDVRRAGTPAHVLVVDDNVQAVELMATVLEAEGYRVLRAYGGAEAIEVARSARPDLMILDLMMPQVSGFEVAHALRKSEHTARIPILVLTAMDLSAEDRARLNGVVSAIMAKSSFSRSELLAELRRAMAMRKPD